MSELDDHTQRLIARLRDWHARNHPSDCQCDESVAADLIAGLTARNATLERVLGEVEEEVEDIDGHLQGGDDPDFTDSLRLDAIMDNVDRLRTILAGAKADSPNERNHQ